MKFYCAPNLVTSALEECLPWEFKPTEQLTAQIRTVKEDRQRFYQSKLTQHCFYTAIVGFNERLRVGKENPPRIVGGFIADYDIPATRAQVDAAVERMPFKPSWLETSLGGNYRLIWTLEEGIPVDNRLFCTFVLQKAVSWLSLELLPGLDKKAFEETSRLYCNGCEWFILPGKAIPASQTQAFFVECGKEYRFDAGNDDQVPLDVVEAALRKKYLNFDWPVPFEVDSQGPSFWIAESVSPKSAILKAGGMFTFASHAAKPFYSWTDLLGSDFTANFQAEAIAKATKDIYWDGKRFWRKISNRYSSMERTELQNYFKVSCRLSLKPGKDGISQVEAAFEHIYNHQRISGAAPFVFQRPGPLIYQGECRLNIYTGKPVDPSPTEPAGGKQKWGPHGNLPWTSKFLDALISSQEQLAHVLAWHKHFYQSAYEWTPQPGQNIILAGVAGIGKTLFNRNYIGTSVGGFVDASDFLVDGGTFNSHLLKHGHWCLDDDAPSASVQAQTRMQALFKKLAANQQFLCNPKFEKADMCEWMGRIGITTNLDYVSSRIMGNLDNTSMDKISLFRCASEPSFLFPSRQEVTRQISQELPFYLRLLLDWEPPPEVERDVRFGYKAYHDPRMLQRSHQSSHIAPFKEMLVESLLSYFQQNPKETCWKGSVTALLRMLLCIDPMNELVLRSLKLEQTSRYLEAIEREGLLKCEVGEGSHQTRVWTFYRIDHEKPSD